MAGTTSQLSDWILEGARLQDSSERLGFGATLFQPHLVQAKRCAPHWDAGTRGASARGAITAGGASELQKTAEPAAQPGCGAGSPHEPRWPACLSRLSSASRSPLVGAQKPLASNPQGAECGE